MDHQGRHPNTLNTPNTPNTPNTQDIMVKKQIDEGLLQIDGIDTISSHFLQVRDNNLLAKSPLLLPLDSAKSNDIGLFQNPILGGRFPFFGHTSSCHGCSADGGLILTYSC
jgi:hypothetical protein